MKVKDIMSRGVACISPESSLQDAAGMMAQQDIGFLAVCTDSSPIQGVLTDRDIVIRGLTQHNNSGSTAVKECMSTAVKSLPEDAEISQAAGLMREQRIRRIIVVRSNGEPSGILSLGDLAKETNDPEFSGEVLEKVSQPAGTL